MKSERALVRRLRQGDREAFRQFYERMLGPLYRYVYFRAGGNREITEDIVHDTFLRAIGSLSGFSPRKGSLQAWLCGIARNCLHEHHRSLQKQREVAQSLGRSQSNRSNGAELSLHDTKARVNSVLALLPEPYERALIQKHVERKSVREIARMHGKSEKAIESLLGRARKAFRRHFRETWPNETEGAA